jgi:hypothetical protein
MKKQKKASTPKRINLAQHITFNDIFTRRRFTNLTKVFDLSADQLEEIHALYQEIDANELDSEQVTRLLENVDKQVAQIKAELPIAVQKRLAKAKNLRPSLAYTSQIKVVLSIIAYGRHYEKTRANLEVSFTQMWIDLKSGLFFLTSSVSSRSAEVEGKTLIRVVTIDEKKTNIYQTAGGTYTFTCGAAICVDGAPNAYGPNDSGTDANKAAGHNKGDAQTYKRGDNGRHLLVEGKKVPEKLYGNTNWWGVVTNTGKNDGAPIVKTEGDHAGFYISTTSYNYAGFGTRKDVQERYVNANIVPYAVLSKEFLDFLKAKKLTPVKLGDLIHVKNNDNGSEIWTGFLEGRNEDDRIGEVSKAAAEVLGINSDPRKGGVDAPIITYTVYPNTAPNGLFQNDAEAIDYISRNGDNINFGMDVDKDPPFLKTEPIQ